LATKFPAHARALMEAFFNTEPYREFESYINFFTIAVASPESGSDHPSLNFFVETYFNSSFESHGVARLVTIPPNNFNSNYADGHGKVYALLAELLPDYDLIVMAVNDLAYGGAGGPIAITTIHESGPDILTHETAHTLALLGDEYESSGSGPSSEHANVTQETNRDLIKWRNWILPSTPIPTPETPSYISVVGLFPGANYSPTGWYRPKFLCKMRESSAPFCEVCAEALTLNIYNRISLVDRFSPASRELYVGQAQTVHFNVTTLRPRSHPPTVQWFVDDNPVPGATQDAFSLATAQLTPGYHSVGALVSDPSTFVRTDAGNILTHGTRWDLLVAADSGPAPAPVLNISTRARVETGEKVTIGGFILNGAAPKKLIVRAIGPSLRQRGVADAALDPTLALQDAAQNVIATNDDWRIPNEAEIQATALPPEDDREAAIVTTLQPGAYTAVVTGKGGTSGVALVEIYDLQPDSETKLANISTRGSVGTGEAVMIGGFIVGSTNAARSNVVVRAIGPSLASAGIVDALQDPALELRDQDGQIVIANNDWKDSQQAELETSGLRPSHDRESAALATLVAGAYTVVVAGKNEGTGVGLIEVYKAAQ
jgi:hypothetical protein